MDSFLCLFVCYPMMVFYWRGIWDLWGVYIDPQEYPAPKWNILGISSLAFIGYFLGPFIQKKLDRDDVIKYTIVTRCFMFVYAAFYMGFWRSWWETLDHYFTDHGLTASLINFFITYPILLLLRSSRSCIFPPMFILPDTRRGVLSPSTRFSTEVHDPLNCMSHNTLVFNSHCRAYISAVL